MLSQFMEVFATPVTNVIIKLLQTKVLGDIKNTNMKVSATLVTNVDIKQLLQVISIYKGVCYPCSQCYYKATVAGSLTKHVESIHEGVRYPCDQCNHKATDKGNLKKHRKLRH